MWMAQSACSGPQVNVEASQKRYDLASDEVTRGDLDSAETEAKTALSEDPQNADAAELIGDIYLLRADQKTQFIEIDQCAQGQEADDYAQSRDDALKLAEHWFNEAIAMKNDDARAMDNLGVAAINLKDWDQVVKVDTDAIGIEDFPARYLAEGDLGWAYYNKGDLLHALEQLKLALSQGQDYCLGNYRLAEVYFAQGQLDDAQQSATVVDQKFNTCPIQENERLLGLIRVKQNDLPGAASYFKKCLSISPKSCVANDCSRYLQQVSQ
jgi:tetratricopeptide (TPR) repeat protein